MVRRNSIKRQAQVREYNKKRDAFLEANPICMAPGCSQPSTLHHAKGKIGDDLTNEEHFRNLCWPHHKYVEEHPEWAKERGYSISRLAKA